MSILQDRFADAIAYVLHGFDRLVFKGRLLGLMHPEGVTAYLQYHGIQNKEFKTWAMEQSDALSTTLEERVRQETGRKITYLRSSRDRKEDLARRRQKELDIGTGVIGAWSCVEAGQSFRATFNPNGTYPIMRPEWVRCKHLYLYVDHPLLGWMSLRLQTWLPYHIQIAINGREWLRRQLDAENIDYLRTNNKFIIIDDFSKAQKLLTAQLRTDWFSMLDSLVPLVFPLFPEVAGSLRHYSWTIWQSEWASDYICNTVAQAQDIMKLAVNHSLLTGSADRLLQYFARPVTKDGRPYRNNSDDIHTATCCYHDGARVRHWVGTNSVKIYNEANNVRIETTVNDPTRFKAMRTTENPEAKRRAKQTKHGGKADKPTKQRLPIRKTVADTTLRARVSQDVNDRFATNLAECVDQTSFQDSTEACRKARTSKGRRIRALELFGKDRELIAALADHNQALTGITNASIKEALRDTDWAKGRTDRQLTARISRHLRLLRDHGLIRKVPGRRRYHVTPLGARIAAALCGALQASTQELMEKVA